MPHVVDRLLAALGLLVLSPVLLAAAIWIKLDSRGPVVYRQLRVGKDGSTFEMLKLRTMKEGSDPVGVGTVVGQGDPRVTRPGELMRRTSIDEIPNLVNVLRGEMAIVGPRPIVEAEVPLYGDVFRLYQTVKPGITGLWQASGRTNLNYADRVLLDQFYIRHWSPWLDVYILAKTVVALVNREGAY